MLTNVGDELKWNINFLVNNPNFQTKQFYQAYKNNVFIFRSYKHYKNGLLFFMKQNYIQNGGIFETYCYFCETYVPLATIFTKDNDKCYLCDECIAIYKQLKMNTIRITDNLFQINGDVNSSLKYDAICYTNSYTKNGHNRHIIYDKLIIPNYKYNYFSLLSCIMSNDFCDLCHNNKFNIYGEYDFFNNDNNQYNYDIKDICIDCLKYALQLFIDNNYEKYMLIQQFDLNDVRSLIIHKYLKLNWVLF